MKYLKVTSNYYLNIRVNILYVNVNKFYLKKEKLNIYYN